MKKCVAGRLILPTLTKMLHGTVFSMAMAVAEHAALLFPFTEDPMMNVLFVMLLGLIAAEAPAVTNAGFEKVNEQTGMPSGWSFTSLPKGTNLVRYKTKAVREGRESRALFISVAADHPEKNVAYNAHQDLRGFVAGKTYRVSAKVQTQGLRTLPMVVVQCLDESGAKHLASSRSPERKLKEDVVEWENVAAQVTIPTGTSTVRLRIGIPAEGNAGGTALIDDVEIVEVE
jgi:hypothetical protein